MMEPDTSVLPAGLDHSMAAPTPAPTPPAGPCLVLGNRVFPLKEGDNLLGRDTDAEVRLDSAAVSRRHARISIAPDATTLEDLQSRNGTIVRDTRIDAPVPLLDGDAIRVGTIWLVYVAGEKFPDA